MMRKLLLLIVLTVWVPGCASFVASIRPVALSTTPDGATATADAGRLDCITPCFLKLKANSDHAITFHKEGYQDASVALVSVGSGWLLRDVTLHPVALLEFTHPEAYSLSQDNIQVMLTPLPKVLARAPIDSSPSALLRFSQTGAEPPQPEDIREDQNRQTRVIEQQYLTQQVRQYLNHQNSASRLKNRKFPLLGLLSTIGIGGGSGF